MKKIFLLVFLGFLFYSCKKDPKSLLDYIKTESIPITKTPVQLTGNFFTRINANGDIYGNNIEGQPSLRFYSDNDFLSYKLQQENIGNSSTSSYTKAYDDGNTSLVFAASTTNSAQSVLLKSTDHGFTYSNYITIDGKYNSENVTTPSFINRDTAFYVTSIYCTTCAGTSYNMVLHKIESGQDIIVSTTPISSTYLTGVVTTHFFNENIGWVILDASSYYNSQLSITKTTDGGLTWSTPIPIGTGLYSSPDKSYVKTLKAFNDHVLICALSGNNYYSFSYYKSTDSGQTWKYVDMYSKSIGLGGNITDFQFVTENIGYIFMNVNASYGYQSGYLYKTTDGGNSWQKVSSKLIYGNKLYFFNENIGVVTTNAIIQKTIDGGKTFELVMYPHK